MPVSATMTIIIHVYKQLHSHNATHMHTNTCISYSGFFHGWKFSLFNFSWVDILAFEATLHRICIVEEILVELILAC